MRLTSLCVSQPPPVSGSEPACPPPPALACGLPLQAGELDVTKRSDTMIRDDRIMWILGGEQAMPLTGAFTQLLRSTGPLHPRSEGPG